MQFSTGLLIILFVFVRVYAVDCVEYKCVESVKLAHLSCTIINLNENFANFRFHPDYNPESITSLTFINSTFNIIPAELFIYFRNLTRFDLSNSGVQKIVPRTFQQAVKLQNLTLSHNNLIELYDLEFVGASNLKYIDISYNRIGKFDGQPFKTLKKLEKIDLSHNQINSLPNNIFSMLNLNELSLNFNQIKNSSTLNITNNGSVSLNNNELESLNLDNDHGIILHADHNGLRSDDVTTENVQNLIYLSLRYNNLTNLNFLRTMPYLAHLDLSYNPLHYDKGTDLDIFFNLNHLKTLILRSVNTVKFDCSIFNNLPASLHKLDISSNNLSSIDFNSLSTLDNLRELYINENHLADQTLEDFEYLFPELKIIDISANNWRCTDLKKILALLKKVNVKAFVSDKQKVRNITNIQGISCIEDSIQQKLAEISENGSEDELLEETHQNVSSNQSIYILLLIILILQIIVVILMIYNWYKNRQPTKKPCQNVESISLNSSQTD